MATEYTFPCGCSFPIISEDPLRLDWDVDYTKLNLDCKVTWDLICSGRTKGCFQIESNLGKRICKDAKPRNISELSDVIAIMRPGCLEAKIDNKNLTNHYIDRKCGKEDIEYLHPVLEPILQETQGVIIYQEECLRISQDIAGFDLSKANLLRSAIGKKVPEKMAKAKIDFISGCKKVGKVSDEEAEEIFSWIEKAQRYGFNKSHAVSYAYTTYLTAYTKAHFIKAFYKEWLSYTKSKSGKDRYKEIQELIDASKIDNIEVHGPDIRKRNRHFKIYDNLIYFGLMDIKNVGQDGFNKLYDVTKNIDLNEISWPYFLINCSTQIPKDSLESLIAVGALSHFNLSRNRLNKELGIFNKLTNTERVWLKDNLVGETLIEMLSHMHNQGSGRKVGIQNITRLKKIKEIITNLKNDNYSNQDNPIVNMERERSLLGIPLNYIEIDNDVMTYSNCTCSDILNKIRRDPILLGCLIDDVRKTTIKNGDRVGEEMAILQLRDDTGLVDGLLFPDAFQEFGNLATKNRSVLACGKIKKDALIIEKIWDGKVDDDKF